MRVRGSTIPVRSHRRVPSDPSPAFQTFESPDPSSGCFSTSFSYPAHPFLSIPDPTHGLFLPFPCHVDRVWTVPSRPPPRLPPRGVLVRPPPSSGVRLCVCVGGWGKDQEGRPTPTSTPCSCPKQAQRSRFEAESSTERWRKNAGACERRECRKKVDEKMHVAVRVGPKAALHVPRTRTRAQVARAPLVVQSGFQRSPAKRKQDIGGPPTNPPPVRPPRCEAASRKRSERTKPESSSTSNERMDKNTDADPKGRWKPD